MEVYIQSFRTGWKRWRRRRRRRKVDLLELSLFPLGPFFTKETVLHPGEKNTRKGAEEEKERLRFLEFLRRGEVRYRYTAVKKKQDRTRLWYRI